MNESKNHVVTIANLFKTQKPSVMYQILLMYGMPMTPKKTDLTGSKELGQCYRNSLNSLYGSQTYCEGFAVCPGLIPLEHAWIMDDDGRIIDPTWAEGQDYFGVEFSREFASQFALRVGHYSIFGNLYRLRMSPEEAIAYLEGGIVK